MRAKSENPTRHGVVHAFWQGGDDVIPPGQWIYVGDYPGDPDTTPDSPPFLNGWSNTGGGLRRLRFRLTNENAVEVEGNITGGPANTVAVTLAGVYSPSEDTPIVGTVEGLPAEWTLLANGNLVVGEEPSGGGAVSSVSAADSSVVISPTTGAVLVAVGTIDGGSP